MNTKLTPLWIGSTPTTRLGTIWVALSERGLVAVDFGISRLSFEKSVGRQMHRDVLLSPHRTSRVVRQLHEYAEGNRHSFKLVIDWSSISSDFQRSALRFVYSIPYGQTRSYGQVAAQIGHPKAARAVGRANAANPMPLVIPCHRVIGTDGKLHGYGGKGGIKTKEWLLRMESSR